MVREQGNWQVNAFVDDDRANVGPGAWFKQIPFRDDLNVLTADTIKIFRESIEAGDMEAFYRHMSDSFTIGITLERLQEAYQPYINGNFDLTGIESLQPTFQELPVFEDVPLGIDEEDFFVVQDVMVLKGYYPLKPRPVPFKFSYVYEHPEWKLFQFQVVKPTISGLSPQDCILWLQTQENKDPSQCFDLEENRKQRGDHYRQSLTKPRRLIRCLSKERRDTIRSLVGVGTSTSHRGFKTDDDLETTPSKVLTWPHRLED